MKRSAACCLLLSLTGCGTSPEPSYYLLAPVDGAADTALTINIVVTRPTLPDYLDQPGMVRRENGHEISVDDMNRWAAPLDSMFEDVLAADLRQRLPAALVQKQGDYLQPKDGFYLESDIGRFDRGDDGAVLSAQIVIDDKGCKTQGPHASVFHAELQNGDERNNLDLLIGQLADRMVEQLRAKSVACGSAS